LSWGAYSANKATKATKGALEYRDLRGQCLPRVDRIWRLKRNYLRLGFAGGARDLRKILNRARCAWHLRAYPSSRDSLHNHSANLKWRGAAPRLVGDGPSHPVRARSSQSGRRFASPSPAWESKSSRPSVGAGTGAAIGSQRNIWAAPDSFYSFKALSSQYRTSGTAAPSACGPATPRGPRRSPDSSNICHVI